MLTRSADLLVLRRHDCSVQLVEAMVAIQRSLADADWPTQCAVVVDCSLNASHTQHRGLRTNRIRIATSWTRISCTAVLLTSRRWSWTRLAVLEDKDCVC